MKHLKILGLALVAAAALMAFVGAGTASATKLCKVATSPCPVEEDYPAGTAIESSLSGSAVLETTGGTLLDTCTGGEVNGTTNTTEGAPLKGEITAINWTGCTKTTDTTVKGSLTIEKSGKNDGNGTLTGDGSSVTVSGIFNTSCVYGTTTGTPLGTLVGNSPATININALVPRTVANSLCPAETRWTASYTVTKPSSLYVG